MPVTLTTTEHVTNAVSPDSHPNVRLHELPSLRARGLVVVYRADFPRIALGYSLLGAGLADLARLFGVTEKTMLTWIDEHREFAEAVQEGRTKSDTFVATALYRRACGYTQTVRRTEVLIEREPSTKRRGKEVLGKITRRTEKITETEVHIPADPGAAARWLAQRQRWRHAAEADKAITAEDVLRFAELARAEAARRGIDLAEVDADTDAVGQPAQKAAARVSKTN
jgi:hypothetical protein